MHDYSKIQFIEVYGLRRSGNHAIIAWLLHNLNETSETEIKQLISPIPEDGFISQSIGNVIHLNDLGSDWSMGSGTYVRGLIDAYISTGKNIVVLSYEDVGHNTSLFNYGTAYKFLQNSTKIVISRDILNIVSSRIKKNKVGFGVNERVFTTWLTNENIEKDGGTLIRFEDWLTSKEYRDRISKGLNIRNLDFTGHVSNAGGGSSFKDQSSGNIDTNALLNRSKFVELPEDILNLLDSDEIKQKRIELGYIKD